jgi:hypothetical protein
MPEIIGNNQLFANFLRNMNNIVYMAEDGVEKLSFKSPQIQILIEELEDVAAIFPLYTEAYVNEYIEVVKSVGFWIGVMASLQIMASVILILFCLLPFKRRFDKYDLFFFFCVDYFFLKIT